ncbi:MAG: hypothetical protein ACRC1K_26165, partial [Planctomycetia bacterium]
MKTTDRRRPTTIGLILAATVFLWAGAVQAQTTDGAEPPPAAAVPAKNAAAATTGFFQLLEASGWIGGLILLVSVAAGALVVEHLLTLRRAVVAPRGLARELHGAV